MTDINQGITVQANQLAIDACHAIGQTGPGAQQISLNKSLWYIDQAVQAGFGKDLTFAHALVQPDGTLVSGELKGGAVTKIGVGHLRYTATGNFTVRPTSLATTENDAAPGLVTTDTAAALASGYIDYYLWDSSSGTPIDSYMHFLILTPTGYL
jgi:hypothetical protein